MVPRRTKTTGMNTANRMIKDEECVGSVVVSVRFSANAIKLSKLTFGCEMILLMFKSLLADPST